MIDDKTRIAGAFERLTGKKSVPMQPTQADEVRENLDYDLIESKLQELEKVIADLRAIHSKGEPQEHSEEPVSEDTGSPSAQGVV